MPSSTYSHQYCWCQMEAETWESCALMFKHDEHPMVNITIFTMIFFHQCNPLESLMKKPQICTNHFDLHWHLSTGRCYEEKRLKRSKCFETSCHQTESCFDALEQKKKCGGSSNYKKYAVMRNNNHALERKSQNKNKCSWFNLLECWLCPVRKGTD